MMKTNGNQSTEIEGWKPKKFLLLMGHQFTMLGDELVSTVIDYYRDYYRLAKMC